MYLFLVQVKMLMLSNVQTTNFNFVGKKNAIYNNSFSVT